MKKIILIILLVIIAGGGALAAIVGYRVNSTYGLSLAEAVSHSELADSQTRVRAVLALEQLRDRILAIAGEDIVLPAWMPFDLNQAVDQVLPREVALLAGPDWSGSQYKLTLFANEKRGGPFIVETVNKSDIFNQIEWIQWEPDWAILERRGVITARGAVPIPPNAEMRVLAHWTHDVPEEALEIEGGHLLEATFDNRNGDSMTVFATLMTAFEVEWEELIEVNPMMKNMLDMFPLLYTLRATVDLLGPDEASIVLRLHAHDDARPQLTFLGNAIILPEIKKNLRQQHNLVLDGEIKWEAETSTAVAEFVLSGLEDFIDRMMHGGTQQAPVAPEA